MNYGALAIDAFAQLGIEARGAEDGLDATVDLLIDPDGARIAANIKYRSLVTDDVVERLRAASGPSDAVLLVVADRVTDAARTALVSRGGYLDLRGRLALRAGRMVIDAAVEPVKQRPDRASALSGKSGLEVATALLMQPDRTTMVREVARQIQRSPSTVSEVLAALRRADLIDAQNAVNDTELFWEVADRWSTPRTHVARLPGSGEANLVKPLRLGLDDVEREAGWALTNSAAAAAYGAPLGLRAEQVVDFFVPDESIVRRAISLLGLAGSTSQARATVRVAPVPAVVQKRIDLKTKSAAWPLAHPLFVALDLALDVGRGREILEAWTPDDRWTRVW